ncbi:uncharacterized protein LOC117327316 isoform X2 [Pecten maximus]|uniref:uncharacterized protein LOC117327316 isoform X2 n=1 Tax=Pecten maximus TaxID=6579 RepID=UPI001458C779|nr:uncharacterized protein LOC117327316 isoform X2 [Pecten maximus]
MIGRHDSRDMAEVEEDNDILPDLPEGARHRSGRRRSSIHIEDEYLEGGRRLSIEGYLKGRRRSSFRRGSSSLDLAQFQKKHSQPKNPFEIYSSEPLWEQYEDEPDIPDKWKGNTIDRGSLYSLKKEHIAGRELPFLVNRPSKKDDENVIINMEQKRERDYISRSHLTDNSQTKFNHAVIQHFYKAPAPRAHPGYGMPRPETSENSPFRLLMKDLERDPSVVAINNYPSLTVPPSCSKSPGFCEILGPSACALCIEGSNRFIGEELQKIIFPEIEMTTAKLVQPKLAKVMREGHLNQMRKLKLREIPFPKFMLPLKRQESNLLGKTMSALRRERSKLSSGPSKHSSYSVSSRTTHLTAVHEENA